MLYPGVRSGPLIKHINKREEDGDELLDAVCSALHVNAAAKRLFLFYCHCPENYMVHQDITSKEAKIYITDIYRSQEELRILKLINVQDHYIMIDWDRLRLLAKLDPAKTAHVIKGTIGCTENPIIDPPDNSGNSTINSQLRLSTDLLDSPFDSHYLNMTNGEFENLKNLYISLTTEDDDPNQMDPFLL